MLVALVLVVQPVLWNYGWDALVVEGEDDPSLIVDLLTNYLGAASIGLALVVAALCSRRGAGFAAGTTFRLGQLIGGFACGVAAVFSGLALASMILGSDPQLSTGLGMACVTGFVLVPMGFVVRSARRCLQRRRNAYEPNGCRCVAESCRVAAIGSAG